MRNYRMERSERRVRPRFDWIDGLFVVLSFVLWVSFMVWMEWARNYSLDGSLELVAAAAVIVVLSLLGRPLVLGARWPVSAGKSDPSLQNSRRLWLVSMVPAIAVLIVLSITLRPEPNFGDLATGRYYRLGPGTIDSIQEEMLWSLAESHEGIGGVYAERVEDERDRQLRQIQEEREASIAALTVELQTDWDEEQSQARGGLLWGMFFFLFVAFAAITEGRKGSRGSLRNMDR